MPLNIGDRLGHYNVTALIGEGGMGQVWQATDTQLNRQVALKILPDAFAADPERLARFKREAQILASLNHPNIAAIYGIEQSDDIKALVLELVEGPTLAGRIAHGAMPIEDALPIARQIAEALEAAHEAGVIHRDLKPANIKVKDDGTVKVLDFGLAKALDPNPEGDPSQSPTLTAAATQMGVILGTAAYMAPEQAKGKVADKRADIWSFGVVLHEMLTGHRVFRGETVSETLAAVMMKEPDWDRLPTDLPPTLSNLVRRCLEKDPRERVRDVGDVRLAMKGAFETTASEPKVVPPVDRQPRWGQALPWVAGLMLAIITGLTVWSLTQPDPPRVVRFVMSPDGAERFHIGTSSPDIAISPNGEHIAYLTGGVPGLRAELLHVQPLGRLTSDVLVAEGDLNSPFFSPDGASMGFYDRRGGTDPVLQRVAVRGGPVSTICALPGFLRGASWGADDTIIFATSDPASGLWRVAAVGGEPEQLTTPDTEQGEVDHRWPEFLPGGEAVLFTIAADSIDESLIAVLSLGTGQQKILVRGGSSPRYSPSGHLLYAVQGNLWAVRFDLNRLETVGDSVPVQEGVLSKPAGVANFSVSENGSLVYLSGTAGTQQGRSVVWVDPSGQEEPLGLPERDYDTLSLSADGTRAAFGLVDGSGNSDIWVSELSRGTLTRLTTDDAWDGNPLWSPDGRRVVFRSDRNGQPELFWQAADGSGPAESLMTIDESVIDLYPYGWSPDGSILLVQAGFPDTRLDVGMVSTEAPGTWEPLIQTAAAEWSPAISPDGRWLAYSSAETGRNEIYVQRFPELEGRRQISVAGGFDPYWSADGREIFYAGGGPPETVMRVTLDVDDDDPPSLLVGTPERLFDWQYFIRFGGRRHYDVSSDGRFLMIARARSSDGEAEGTEINVVLNWHQELLERVPIP